MGHFFKCRTAMVNLANHPSSCPLFDTEPYYLALAGPKLAMY